MDMTEITLKKLQAAKDAVRENAESQAAFDDVCSSAGRLMAHTVAQSYLTEKAKRTEPSLAKKTYGLGAIGSFASRCNLVFSLAEAIDRFLIASEKEDTAAPAEEIEEACEEVTPEAPVVEEAPAVPAFAQTEEVVAADGDDDDDDRDDDREDDENDFGGIDTSGLEFINVMEQPEEYQRMLEQERAGEVRLINRYRYSFTSRLVQSRGNAQEYYNAFKNAFLSYKGVKGRISWSCESINKGRAKVAKVNVKNKTVYLYLAINPAELVDSKYFFDDVSAKKKYEDTPVLFKVKGERKFKQALELIEKVCGEQMQLPPVKNFEAQDYTVPFQNTEELVQAGYIKQFTAAVPISVVVTAPPIII